MGKEWTEYPCSSGETLFLYNKVTGEHKWPNGSGKGVEGRIIPSRPVEYKEYSTIATQTDDDSCNDGCMSIYINTDPSDIINTSQLVAQNKDINFRSQSVSFNSQIKRKPRDVQEEEQRSAGPNSLGQNSQYNDNVDNDDHTKNTSRDTNNKKLELKDGFAEIIRVFEVIVSALENSFGSNSSSESGGYDESRHKNEIHVIEATDDHPDDGDTDDNTDDDNALDNNDNNNDNCHESHHEYDVIVIDDIDDIIIGDSNSRYVNHENDDDHDDDASCKEFESTTVDDNDTDDYSAGNNVDTKIPLEHDIIIVDDIDDIPDDDNHDNNGGSKNHDENANIVNGHNGDADDSSDAIKLNSNRIRKKHLECSVCKRNFTAKSSFNGHMRTHTGEKPFQCSVCKKNFALRVTLNRHMRTHTGERPYKCSVCKTKFARKSSLNRHMRINTH